jgi:quinohemoprotein ethanol dehydrogenase
VAFNGGVLATAGNLVFQGDANGLFSAYRADTGERLWSMATGSAITAAPVSYSLPDRQGQSSRQHVLIPVGAGSGMQFAYPSYHAGAKALGPTRLLSFSLDGKAALPAYEYAPPVLPELLPLTASAEEIDLGERLFQERGCAGCHGKNAVARAGGTVPDLRYATPETHLQWPGIVIGGARSAKGMPAHELSTADSEAIRSYVLSQARALAEDM